MLTINKIRDEIEALGFRQRVANGVRWLNENFPGWQDRIDIDTLELASSYSCICGQLFDDNAKSDSNTVTYDGFTWASSHLLEQANSWISTIIPNDFAGYRRYLVSAYLGFDINAYHEDEQAYAGLQTEWIRYLAEYRNSQS